MWAGLDAVDWAGLKHNYGSAEGVPGLLRRCGGPDPDDADDASSELLNLLFHQGGWVCSAASAALPFVLRLAATPQVPSRCAMLELVAMLAAEAGRIEARFLDPGWASVWKEALPELLGLLDDPEPKIRRAAADVLGVCDSPGEFVLPGLLRCWEAEEDLATRLELVLSLGRAALRAPVGGHGAEVFDLLRGLLDSPQAQIRLAAVRLARLRPGREHPHRRQRAAQRLRSIRMRFTCGPRPDRQTAGSASTGAPVWCSRSGPCSHSIP